MEEKKKRKAKKYSELSPEARAKNIARATKYTKEKTARTTIKMSKELDAAMNDYIIKNGYKSKNSFILGLIKERIKWDNKNNNDGSYNL